MDGFDEFRIVERWVRERMCSFIAEVAIFESHSNNGRSAALPSFFTSISLFSNSFLGQRFSSLSLELLALGERIGNVNTGLSEDVISKCLRETKIYSNRSHEEGTLHLSYKKCNRLIALVIAAGLGVLTHKLGTLVLLIGASGFATTAATIGTVVDGFR